MRYSEGRSAEISTDILVLGGGIAGCFAAIRAKEAGAQVLLVDKGCLGRSGLSFMMSGILTYFDPEKDNYDQWYNEIVEVGEWLNDQTILQGMIIETTERIREMDDWGVSFQKEGGEFIRRPAMKHMQNVLLTNSGYQMMSVMRGEVLRRGVRVIERFMATDLLTSDGEHPTGGRVIGAIGFNTRTGKFHTIKARAVIIATGDTRSLSTNANTPVCSGDGKAMAFRVGCEMRNADLYHFSLQPLGHNTAPGLNILIGEGAFFINSKGDRFMPKWDPVRADRAPRALIGRAMAMETLEGRGPVFLDATHLDETSYGRIEKCIPIVVRSLDLAGLSLRKDRIPYGFGRSDLDAGGVRVNREAETTIPGLYVAGAANDMGQSGAASCIQAGIESAIWGHRAGKASARAITDTEEYNVDEGQVNALLKHVLAPMKRTSGLNHHEVREHFMDISDRLGLIKSEAKLNTALEAVQEIKENEIPRVAAKDYHELARATALTNEVFFLELFSRCSLVRKESRGGHFREDYPERDDANWLRWVIARRNSGGMEIWTEPVPYDQYPLKPEQLGLFSTRKPNRLASHKGK